MDVIDVKTMSAGDRYELAEELKKKRNKVAVPETLQVLAMKTVAKHHDTFIGQIENPFRYLPNTVVQSFLKLIVDARDRRKHLVPKKFETEFVLLLLNENVTEFDCNQFSYYSRSKDEVYYKHLLDNCPKITKIGKSSRNVFTRVCDEVPYLDLIKWKNLKHFSMQGFYCKDETIEYLKDNFPKLEGMEFYASTAFLTMAAVEHMSKMENLKYLFINFTEGDNFEAQEIIVHLAGRVPNLQRLDFDDMSSSGSKFVELYGKHYPNKKLLVNEIRLNSEFQATWPSCLSVDRFTFQGHLSEVAVEKICTITCPLKKVTFDDFRPSRVYPILDKLGSSVTDLEFGDISRSEKTNNAEKLNMYRVLSACPNIEHFLFSNDNAIEKVPKYKVSSRHFENFKSFMIYSLQEDGSQDEMNTIFEMFITMSKNYDKKLSVNAHGQLVTLLNVLKRDQKYLDKVQKIEIEIYEDEMLEKALEAATFMILRSPYLEKVKFNVCSFDPRGIPRMIRRHHSWFKEFIELVGVRLKIIDQMCPETEDSSMGECTDMDDDSDASASSDEEASGDEASDNGDDWIEYSDDNDEDPSDASEGDSDSEDNEAPVDVQCPAS